MALAEARQTALQARLGPGPAKPGFTAAARQSAGERLARIGLPQPRDEYWRYTNPAALNAPEPPEAVAAQDTSAPIFDALDRLKIVFTDGLFDAKASDPLALDGIEIARLAQAMTSDIHWAGSLYGRLEAEGQSPVARPFAALNTLTAGDGLLIRVTGKVACPISLIYRRSSANLDAVLHHCIRIEPGADLTLLENGTAAARANTVLEVDIAEGGGFHHVRSQGRDPGRRAVTHIFARLADGASFKSFTLAAGGALIRNEAVIDMAGNMAVAHIAGAALGDGARDPYHHDDTVFIRHGGLDGESRQVFKKVLRNAATGVFQGKILVSPGAQRTDGYQISQALLLDEDSQFLAKPELEIYADDVKCSHGSTSGSLDGEALFYLRSRGIERPEAEALLVLSFLADAVAEIEDAAIAGAIGARLEGWLEKER